MKPDYKNWVPKSMVYGLAGGTLAAFILFLLFGAAGACKADFTKKRCEENTKAEGLSGSGKERRFLWIYS